MQVQQTTNEYDMQAEAFLAKHGIKFSCVLKDTKTPKWEPSGHHFRVTLRKSQKSVSFDFFGSKADKDKGILEERAYSVLACISGDVSCPDTFAEFCAEYGYNVDSIKDQATFRECDKLAKRLRAFFTEAEIADLQEIQ